MTATTSSYIHLTERLKASAMDDLAFKKVITHFANIHSGCLIIICDKETTILGQQPDATDLVVTLHVRQKAMFRHIIFNGMVGAAEMYMADAWECTDLLSLVKLMCRNIDVLNGMDQKRSFFKKAVTKLMHYRKQNTLKGSKKNITAHYDLNQDFFATFLDPSMMYSAAIFKTESTPLETAAIDKIDIICQKLQLKPTDHLLEIGTGWGTMAIHAAKTYGCKVTTTTISENQYRYTVNRVKALGLDQKVTVLKKDYRLLEGQFDKLVSIEMIEAVGYRYYKDYFKQCSALLKKDGLALIQAITISDQRYEDAKTEVDFIQQYIFPGGCLPSVSVIAQAIAEHTDMQMADLHDITADYVKTLNIWRQNFYQAKDKIKALGFDDMFYRMWEYYLCYCEGGFAERVIQDYQILLAKPNTSVIKRL